MHKEEIIIKEEATQFGWDWKAGLPQIILLLWIVLASYGTWRALQTFQGWNLVGCICVCWLLPVIGAFIVIWITRQRRQSL